MSVAVNRYGAVGVLPTVRGVSVRVSSDMRGASVSYLPHSELGKATATAKESYDRQKAITPQVSLEVTKALHAKNRAEQEARDRSFLMQEKQKQEGEIRKALVMQDLQRRGVAKAPVPVPREESKSPASVPREESKSPASGDDSLSLPQAFSFSAGPVPKIDRDFRNRGLDLRDETMWLHDEKEKQEAIEQFFYNHKVAYDITEEGIWYDSTDFDEEEIFEINDAIRESGFNDLV